MKILPEWLAATLLLWDAIKHAQEQPSFQHLFTEALCARSCICYYIVQGRWSKWGQLHLKGTEEENNFQMSSLCIHHYVYILQLECEMEHTTLISKGVDILEWKRFAWHSSKQKESPEQELENSLFHSVYSKHCRLENVSLVFCSWTD